MPSLRNWRKKRVTKSNDKKVPALRFKGFTDDWEQRKLEKMVNFFSGLTYHPHDVRNNGCFVIRSSNIQNNQIVSADDVFVNRSIVNVPNVEQGDIIVVVRNGSRKLIGKHARVQSKMSNTVIGAFMTGLRSDDNGYINALLDSDQFQKEIYKNLGSTINQITTGEFKKMNFMFAKESENKKIGKFFKLVDNLISLQQRKLKLVYQLKKTLLEQLISEKGEPIVRFNSFRKEWERFRLENFITKTIKGKAKAEMVGNRSIYLDTSYLNGGTPSTVDAPTDVYIDDTIILWDGSLAGKVYHGFSGALGSTLKSFTPKYSGEYLFQYLQKSQEKIFKNYRTPNIPHVIKDFTTVFRINAPSLEEQNKISAIFELIDRFTSNQSITINKLKKIKRSLLQKLFI